ncbi:MAG TPA: gliding motility-associated C-terminal domain-containing protein [Flavobacteriales bacterium]|nr:gliding motility-associated C-terminal domain-containing protein [Flavobacteriales bacterium]
MKNPSIPVFRGPRWSRSIVLLLMLVSIGLVHAQNTTVLPTRGTRFWTGFMQNGFGAQSLKVHILSTSATSGTVTIPLTGWSASFSVAANNVAIVDVPTSAENNGSGNTASKGVLIQSNDSVNVFISSFQNFTHDLSQVLPESSLGNTYRVDSYQGLPNFNNLHKSELLVVATQDGTQVRITPSVNTLNGNVAGTPFLVNLNEGQSYQVQAATDALDLTGTLVEATATSGTCRPFVVIGGSMCATVPGACQACDAIFEQLIPVTAWGTRYFTAPISGVNTSTYRVLAHSNGTSISINGGAPIMLNAGQRHEVNGSTAPVCIQANLPVSVVQLLEGYSCAGNGDPSLLLVSPAERMSTRATFSTSTSSQLSQHSVSLIVPVAAVGQITLDGVVVNPSLFQSYPGCTDRKHAKVPVLAGVHRIQAATGFQAYMFGTGYGESYAASVHDIRAVPVQEDSIVCGGGPLTLNAPEPLNNATWSEADSPNTVLATGNSYSFTPTSSGSYTVTGILPVSGCPRSFTYHVGIPLTIPTLLTANDQPSINICQYEPVQLALVPPPDPAWFEIQWSPAYSLDNDTISNPVAMPMTSTWYRVRVISPSGCGNMDDSIRVNVTGARILDLGLTADPPAVCLGNTVQLGSRALRVMASDLFDGTPGSTWTAIQGGVVSNACGSQSGSALYFDGNGQRYAQTVGLNTNGGGQLRFRLKIATDVSPCDNADAGEDVVLEYSTNNGLNWNLIDTYDQDGFPGFEPLQVTIPAPAQTANTMFRLRQLAHNGSGHDNWAVDDFLSAKYDNNWLGYGWSQPGTLNNAASPSPVATPTTTGWYVLSATDPTAGCVYQDSVQVQVDPAFSLGITPNTTLCAVAGLPLTATPSSGTGITYAWSPNNGTLSALNVQSPIATPTSTTTYSVTATTSIGCTANRQVTITVGQLLSFNVTAANDTLCQGGSTQLTATASGGSGLTYAWTGAGLNNAAIANPIATPTQTTTYTSVVTHTASGCTLSQSVTVVVTTGYTANAGPDLTLCTTLGHQIVLQHNVPNPTYHWTPAANLNSSTIASPTILTDATATYSVTISDLNGCSVSDQVTITRAFSGLPAQSSASGCANAPPTLTAPQSGASYLWSTGAVSPTIVPTASGPHTVTITDAQGCEASTTFNVTLFALPVVNLGPDLALCGASSQVLNAGNAGSTFHWNTAATTQQITVSTSGTYSVNVTNTNNCSASDAVNIQLNSLPVDPLQDVTSCTTSMVTLDAGNSGSTYLWNTGAATQTIHPTTSGTYSVAVTTPQNCTATFDAEVTLVPIVVVDLGNDTTICLGSSVVLNAGNPGLSYAWSTGATSQSISVQSAGTYSVVVGNGSCTATDAIVIATQAPPLDVLQDVTQCSGQAALLDAGNAGCTYLWSQGTNAQTLAVNASGTYSVIVTDPIGCSGTFDAVVQLVAPPVVQLGPDTVLCDGEALVVDAGNPGSSYLWSDGSTARTITIREPGTYTALVNNGLCQRSDAIVVAFDPSPAQMATRQFHTCLGEDQQYVRLDAGNPGSRYEWSTGEHAQVILAGAYGWYVVEVTNQFDCAGRDSAQVIEYCPSAIFIPNTFTPNGDGTNDTFIPVGKNIAAMHLYVFDRWGDLLFESDDPTMGWDGTYGGEVVKNDIYVWRLSYKFFEDKDGAIGMEQEQLGHVQVLR